MPTAQNQINSLAEIPENIDTSNTEKIGSLVNFEGQGVQDPNTGKKVETIAREGDDNSSTTSIANDFTDLPLEEEPIDQKRADFLSTIADNMEKVVTRKIWEEAQKNVN